MNRNIKEGVANNSAKILNKVAYFFAGMLCNGKWHEPKMPEKLKR